MASSVFAWWLWIVLFSTTIKSIRSIAECPSNVNVLIVSIQQLEKACVLDCPTANLKWKGLSDEPNKLTAIFAFEKNFHNSNAFSPT